MITSDLFENPITSRGMDNVKALLKAVATDSDATITLNNEPITLSYPEARFMAGKYRAYQKAGRSEEFFRDMADPVAFDDHMRQLRNLISKQKNFRGSVPEEAQMVEKKDIDVSSGNARIDRMLKQLRARNPQANNDLEALIYDYRAAQAQDRRDIKRLDNENDNEEELIARLERDLAKLKSMRGVEEGLRSGEWHDVHVTFDDGSKATVKTTGDSGYRDQITQHFARQGKTVKDIEIDWSVKSEARDRSPGKITKSEDPCWTGYHMVGTKNKGGREVPNCVPGKKGA